jgi:hypothetical protein
MDGLDRPIGTAISLEIVDKRAHGARYVFIQWLIRDYLFLPDTRDAPHGS